MKPTIIQGGLFTDERGSVAFVNDFDLTQIRRFYTITHPDTEIIRAWQGHQKESKWFYCVKGAFELLLVKIDDWENPSPNLKVLSFQLSKDNPQVLAVPPGYASGFRATAKNATLIVYSDTDLETSKKDDFRFDKNLWYNWKIQ